MEMRGCARSALIGVLLGLMVGCERGGAARGEGQAPEAPATVAASLRDRRRLRVGWSG